MDLSTWQADWPGSSFLGSVMLSPNSVRATDQNWWISQATLSNPGQGPGTYALPTSGALGITGPTPQAAQSSVDCSYCEKETNAASKYKCYYDCVNKGVSDYTGVSPSPSLGSSGFFGSIFRGLGVQAQHVGIDIAFAVLGIILVVIALVVLTRQTTFRLVRDTAEA
jgi:hypothetical protein